MHAAARPTLAEGTAPPLPAPAAAISGEDYDLDPNPLDMRRLQLRFLNQARAEARIALRGRDMVVPVGLDGAYQFGIDPASNERVAGRGRWTGPDEFELDIDTIARIDHVTVVLHFEDDWFQGQLRERVKLFGTMPLSGRARH